MLDFSEGAPIHLGRWLADREVEGWKIEWPVSEESYEDMKRIAGERGVSVRPLEGTKAKKDDYARSLGRVYAVEHLG
jgi:endonuclease YncB( thermonuclease family)